MFPTTSICDIHDDIIHTEILSRLDGPTLASVSCASTQLQSLSKKETLWLNICHSTWPSTIHPSMSDLVSEFPDGPRSFLAQCFPPLITHQTNPDLQEYEHMPPSAPPQLISAVDIYYKSKPIFSEVCETTTDTRWFRCSPFRIDLLETKGAVGTPSELKHGSWRSLVEDLKLSWILVIGGTKAANLSSWKPVSVEQHPVTYDIKLKFVSILSVDQEADVMCEIIVTLDEYMEFCEMSMHVEDFDGINLNGAKSLEILQKAIGENRERRKGKKGEQIERYENYVKKLEDNKRSNNKWGSGWRYFAFRAACFWPVLISWWICFS